MSSMLIDKAPNAIATIVLAHGAGADMQHSFLQQLTLLLIERDINVLRFNFPFMDKRLQDGKKRPPDRMPALLACFQQVLLAESLQQLLVQTPLFLAGKSMGARVALSLLAEQQLPTALAEQVKAGICLGYPFHPIGTIDKLRLTPIQQAQKPVLIIQGERDKLGCQAEVLSYDIVNYCQLHFLADGDHDLKPRVRSGFTHQQHLQFAADKIKSFIDEHR